MSENSSYITLVLADVMMQRCSGVQASFIAVEHMDEVFLCCTLFEVQKKRVEILEEYNL